MSNTSMYYSDLCIKLNTEVEYVSLSENQQILGFEIIWTIFFSNVIWKYGSFMYMDINEKDVYLYGRGISTIKELN